ncbi:MAG: glycosyltransferase family 39 protein [Candidatus Sumerlaeaceae bacterium]|nr:glycosyltransferase family 39 protein [Candidatus Sumerlaeaceae bacterium]
MTELPGRVSPGLQPWFPDNWLTAGTLAAITCVGAILRLYGLEVQSLWNDELSSWLRSSYPSWAAVMHQGAYPDTHPPLMYLILHGTIGILGDSPWALRLPAAIFGILAIPAVYRLASLPFGAGAGLVAAMLMALSRDPIYWSQEARSYSLLHLAVTIEAIGVYRALTFMAKGRRLDWQTVLVFSTGAGIACYAHYLGCVFTVMTLVGLAVPSFFIFRRPGAWLALVLAIALLYSPWIGEFLFDLRTDAQWYPPPFSGKVVWEFVQRTFGNAWPFAVVGLLAVILALIPRRATLNPEDSHSSAERWFTAYLFVWMVAPFAAACTVAVVVKPVLHLRYLTFCIPAAYALAGGGLIRIPAPRMLRIGIAAFWGIALLCSLLLLDRYYATPVKEPTRELARWILDEENNRGGNCYLVEASSNEAYLNYCLRRLGSPRRADLYAENAEAIPKAIREIRERKPGYILFSTITRSAPGFDEFLQRCFEKVAVKSSLGVNLYTYKNDWLTSAPDDPLGLFRPAERQRGAAAVVPGANLLSTTHPERARQVFAGEVLRVDNREIYKTTVTLDRPSTETLALLRPFYFRDVAAIVDVTLKQAGHEIPICRDLVVDRCRLVRAETPLTSGTATLQLNFKNTTKPGKPASMEAVRFLIR